MIFRYQLELGGEIAKNVGLSIEALYVSPTVDFFNKVRVAPFMNLLLRD